MVDLIAFGGHQNGEVDSVKKIRVLDTDGPARVNSSTLGAFGTGFCSEIVVAQTWTNEQAMRQATKNIFYTTVNSTAYENYIPSSIPGWLMTTYIVDGVIAAALVVLEIFVIRGYMKKENQNSK